MGELVNFSSFYHAYLGLSSKSLSCFAACCSWGKLVRKLYKPKGIKRMQWPSMLNAVPRGSTTFKQQRLEQKMNNYELFSHRIFGKQNEI